jgi:hypothetical protein
MVRKKEALLITMKNYQSLAALAATMVLSVVLSTSN